MKTKNLIVTLIIVTFVAFSCGGKKTYDESTKSDEMSVKDESSSQDVLPKKWIRADTRRLPLPKLRKKRMQKAKKKIMLQ